MKKLFSLVLALLLVAASAGMIFAARNDSSLPNVYDEADIFTDSEEAAISNKCDEIINKYDLDIAVVVFSKTYGSLMTSADDIYDENGFGCGADNSGTLLYICMDPQDRGWWTSACGRAESYYTEDNINYIDDNLYPYMADGKYGAGVLAYLDLIDELYSNGKFNINQGYTYNPGSYVPDYTPAKYEETIWEKIQYAIVPAGIFGLIAGGISLAVAKNSMKSVAKASTAGHYLDRRSINITLVRDIFLYRSTHRTKIQTESNSSHPGGRSSYSGGHRSSGGAHHSGGGRHF